MTTGTGTKRETIDGKRRAKLLRSIGERMKAVQQEAMRSQASLMAAARAVLDPESEPGSNGAVLDHVEKMVAEPEGVFNRCEKFLLQAEADVKAHEFKSADGAFATYFKCLTKPEPLPE
jgi:hypothetical protein